MSLYPAFDASTPPGVPYPGAAAVMGYIGGNTPHVWTRDEWRRFAALVQFPIWVGVFEADPVGHARQAVSAARALGWSPNPPSGNRRGIIIDYETEVNQAWIDSFAAVVWAAGYETFVYGSESTITGNPPKEGRWIALYNGLANLPDIPYAVAHQYAANIPFDGTAVDLSVVSADMLAHGGQGPRQ